MENNNQSSPLQQTSSTPEVTIAYAGFWRRLVATIIDTGILSLITISIQMSLGQNPFELFTIETLQELEALNQSANQQNVTLITLIIGIIYTFLFWIYYDGATPGKKLVGIHIVKEDGTKIHFPTGIVRYLGYFLSGFVLFLGYLWIAWDKKKQGWHDKIASTIVVKSEKNGNTPLAILLAVIFLVLFLIYFGGALYKGMSLGIKDLDSQKKETQTTASITNAEKNMDPAAKVHYDRSTELFQQMRTSQNDRDTVRKLNDENISELKKALEISPNDPSIWHQLGSAYTWVSTDGKEGDSLNAFKKAEELEPDNFIYINAVGDELVILKRYDEAVLQFQKTLRITDKSGYANLSLGVAYANLGIYDQAIEHYQTAIDIFTEQNDNGRFDDDILKARQGIAEVNRVSK